MNRAVRNLHRRRCALKNMARGGGLDVNPGASFETANGVKIPENQFYSECYEPVRPGSLTATPNVALAQTVMAGGAAAPSSDVTYMDTGFVSPLFVNRQTALPANIAEGTYAMGEMEVTPVGNVVGGPEMSYTSPMVVNRLAGGGGCGCMLRGGLRRHGGGAGCMLRGGAGCMLRGGKRRSTRKQRGGNKGGFGIDPSMSVGGTGPIAEPARFAIPCDPRAGVEANPFTAPAIPNDPRAPAFGYSATANNSFQRQTGGAYSSGNAYPDSCYRATGSQMPVYPATTAGFEFRPSTAAGATLPDGVTAYNEVVPVAARQGGGKRAKKSRKSRKNRKAAKKSRKARKVSKKSRKSSRKH